MKMKLPIQFNSYLKHPVSLKDFVDAVQAMQKLWPYPEGTGVVLVNDTITSGHMVLKLRLRDDEAARHGIEREWIDIGGGNPDVEFIPEALRDEQPQPIGANGETVQ